MKTTIRTIAFLALFFTATVMAQSPQKFNYQGVARNNLGAPLANTTIGLQLSITDGVNTLYAETFTPTTTNLGLFTTEVGNGTIVSGTFNTIDWLGGAKYLKVEMDPAGGTNYLDMGTTQLVSVPYALVAEKVNSMALDELNDVNTAGVVTNQVLQWNGTQWVPANIGGGGSDNWGSQTAVVGPGLSGDGTVGNPLTLAQQSASNGQVLAWNGSAWMPTTINGDNWGSQSVATSSQFSGNGTSGNPLLLAQQGAIVGQNLEWSGISWIPATDDTLRLPYDGIASSNGSLFRVTNGGSGIAIKGINSSTSANVTGVVGQIQNTNPGAGSSGVIGVNNGTNGNGYGVYGLHQGSGVGTYGSSATGIGVYGISTGTGGIGVLAQGNAEGVKGTSNSATGYGVHGVALSGGYGGYFEGRTSIVSNSNAAEPNLLLNETETGDYARLRMTNATPGQFWEIDALNTGVATTEMFHIWNGISGPLFSIRGDGNVGMGNSNPTQRLDVVGNVKFSGALMPNNAAGTSGQVLTSQGAGVAPTWTSSTNGLYNNTYFWDQSNTLTLTTTDQALLFGGFQDLPFAVGVPSKIMVNFSETNIFNYTGGGGDASIIFKIQIKDNLGNIVNQAWVNEVIDNNKNGSVSYTHHCFISTPGNYKINIIGVLGFATTDPDVTVQAAGGGLSTGQVNLQLIPQ